MIIAILAVTPYYIFFYHLTGKKGEWIMKELIKYIAQALVDNSDQVDVQEIKAQQTLVLELRVAKEDLGKVIGKKGRTAQAMRTILSCASAKEQKRVILEIVE
jgi:predicted RNA-binding protein YlqC (UPF0109 family)